MLPGRKKLLLFLMIAGEFISNCRFIWLMRTNAHKPGFCQFLKMTCVFTALILFLTKTINQHLLKSYVKQSSIWPWMNHCSSFLFIKSGNRTGWKRHPRLKMKKIVIARFSFVFGTWNETWPSLKCLWFTTYYNIYLFFFHSW